MLPQYYFSTHTHKKNLEGCSHGLCLIAHKIFAKKKGRGVGIPNEHSVLEHGGKHEDTHQKHATESKEC